MTQPSVIRLSETLPTATHHGFGRWHYEWPWSWAWAWCLRTICHWLPCSTTAFGYATIHCPHSDHTLFDYTLWQTATHSPPHLHSHRKSMDNRAHEWSPRSHQNQSRCLARHILSPCTSSRTEWNYRVTKWCIRNGVSVEEQLGIYLYTCVTGLSSRLVGERFQRSIDTVTK